MIARKTSSISIDSVHSVSSPCSSVGDCDADDEGTMSTDEFKSTSLNVEIPKFPAADGPYCSRRPNLQEILGNTTPGPWSLTSFMAYLSNNHCLETLEFTMDAGRYRKHYQRMMNRAPTPGAPSTEDAEFVKELWNRLIEAYILPNGSREVNLPSEVRDPIVHLTASDLPPAPEVLDPAVEKTYELMEESVLVPFLNNAFPQVAPISNSYLSMSNENLATAPHEDKSRFSRRSRHQTSRSSPPPQGSLDSTMQSPPPMPNRKSAPSALTTALTKSRFSTKLSPTSSVPTVPLTMATSATSSGSDTTPCGPNLTDDSGSSGSPIHDSPMTPPVTPPMSDLSSSPRASRDIGAWKKLGRLSGWKPGKKRSQGFKEQELQ